jgi:hypothetical protein
MSQKEKIEEYFERETPILHDLREALYAVSELNLWPDDVNSVSAQQALLCWKIIEKVKASGFPDELKI